MNRRRDALNATNEDIEKQLASLRVNHKTELEKAFEERYNETIMAATGVVDEMKNIIYHVCYDFSLESAQVLFGDDMYKG